MVMPRSFKVHRSKLRLHVRVAMAPVRAKAGPASSSMINKGDDAETHVPRPS
jgi:hypothetical protein